MLLLRAEEPKPVFLFSQLLAQGFPCSSVGKESACNAGDPGSIPWSERSPGEGNGNLLWYSCLGSPMDRAWQTTLHGAEKSQTQT